MSDILEALPRMGQSIPIPGGILRCEQWTIEQSGPGQQSGEIVFRFYRNLRVVEAREVGALLGEPAQIGMIDT